MAEEHTIDVTKTPANSLMQGFGYLGKDSNVLNYTGLVLGPGATNAQTATFAYLGEVNATTLSQIIFSGVGNALINNINQFFPGSIQFRVTGPPSYDVFAYAQRTAAGMKLTVETKNSTGANQTVPSFSVTLKDYYYAAPW